MTVFLVTVGFVLTFVPGMFQPFDTDTGPNMVVADRTAARLAEDLLVDDVESPGLLNETCTVEFFDADGDVAACRFDQDAADLESALDLEPTERVNVTIEDDAGPLTVTDDGDTATASVGPTPAATGDVVVASRVVAVDGERGTLVVRVW